MSNTDINQATIRVLNKGDRMNKKATIAITVIVALILGLLVYAFMPLSGCDESSSMETVEGVNYDHTVQTIDGQKYIVPNF